MHAIIIRNIDSLIKVITPYENKNLFKDFTRVYNQKSNRSLYILAHLCYTDYFPGSDQFEDLFAALADVFVQVRNKDEEWTWRYGLDYSRVARLNQLIYWANHFEDYQWDAHKNKFINTAEGFLQRPPEIILFDKLSSIDDSTALSAFAALTYYDNAIIEKLPFSSLELQMNDGLPIFQFRFLKVLSKYRYYFTGKKISLELSERAKAWFNKLAERNINFKERYQLENEVIAGGTPNEITALEFWFLVNEQNWDLTYSAGRIIDKYYSYHWNEIIWDTAQLNYYLKKAALFDDLGIIGNCNKYLFKFRHSDSATINRLKHIYQHANDADIIISLQKIFTGLKPRIYDSSRSDDGNHDCLYK